MYNWKIVDGYLIGLMDRYGSSVPVDKNHFLCLEFTHDNVLKRLQSFEGGFYTNDAEKQIIEWMDDAHDIEKIE